jgi:hypothetical protein
MSNKWPKQSECLAKFGNPTQRSFSKNLTLVTLPYTMYMGDIVIKRCTMNKICAESLLRVLTKTWEYYGKDKATIKHHGLDVFSGAHMVRPMRGGRNLSMHAYGLAIDINAPENQLGWKPGYHSESFTDESPMVKFFKEEGWVWGGDWKSRPDGMHFQAAVIG